MTEYEKAVKILSKMIGSLGLDDWEIGIFEDTEIEHVAETEIDFPERTAHIFLNPSHDEYDPNKLRFLMRHELFHIFLSPIRSLIREIFPAVASEQFNSLLASYNFAEETAIGMIERAWRKK